MSPSAHRRNSSPAPEQRQQALIGLGIVLFFVVVGMVIVLARQRQPFTVGDVALPVHDLAKPVAASSHSSSAARGDTKSASKSASKSHSAGVDGVATTRSTGARSSAPVPTTRRLAPGSAGSSHPPASSSPVTHPVRSPVPHRSPASHHPSSPTHHPSSPTHHPSSPSHHPSSPSHHPSGPTHHPAGPSHHPSSPAPHPSHHPTHHRHPSAPPSSSPPPAPSVSIAQGDAVDHCPLPGCDWVNITLNNFSSGSHTISCNTTQRAPYATFSSLLSLITRGCFMFGDDQQVWVTVDGVQSNTITWDGDDGGGSHGGGGHGGGGHGGYGHGGHGHGHGGWGGGHHGH